VESLLYDMVFFGFKFFFRQLGGVCSTPCTEVKWRLKTSARLKLFSAGDPDPGQNPQIAVPL